MENNKKEKRVNLSIQFLSSGVLRNKYYVFFDKEATLTNMAINGCDIIDIAVNGTKEFGRVHFLSIAVREFGVGGGDYIHFKEDNSFSLEEFYEDSSARLYNFVGKKDKRWVKREDLKKRLKNNEW